MGFRNPARTASAVETGTAAPGVRIFADAGNPSSGVVEWHAGPSTVRGMFSSSDTGSGGSSFTLGYPAGFGPYLSMGYEGQAAGGTAPVTRLRGADKIELPPIIGGVRNTGVVGVISALLGIPAPDANTELQVKIWSGNLTASAFGDNTIFWPGNTFPNGLLFTIGDTHGYVDGSRIQLRGGNGSKVDVRFLNAAGATVTNVTKFVTIIGVGW